MAPVLWEMAEYVLRKVKRMWKAKGWGVPFGGEGDDEYRFSGMMGADNYWIFSDDREKLTYMVNDIIKQLMGTWSPNLSHCGRSRTSAKRLSHLITSQRSVLFYSTHRWHEVQGFSQQLLT